MSFAKKSAMCNICFIVFFVMSYLTNRNLMIVSVLIPTIIIIISKDVAYAVAEAMFLLPFSATMTLNSGETSLFMLFKLALIILYFFSCNRKIRSNFFCVLLSLFIYSLLVNMLKGELPVVRILNLLLWFFLAYILIDVLKTDTEINYVCKLFISGVCISGFVGLCRDFIPALSNELANAQYYNETSGEFVERFAGLWNDPNGYTVFLICALFAALWLFTNKKINAVYFAIVTLILSALGILTLSKSCALLIIGFWIYFVFSNGKVGIVKKICAVSIVITVCLAGFSQYEAELNELIYRFTSASKSGFSMANLTTERSTIWKNYLTTIANGDFLFGFGIDAPTVNGYACHNTYLQLLYEWGSAGAFVYIITWINVLDTKRKKMNYIPLSFLLITIFFLSCIYIEFLYFFIPFMICIGGCAEDDKIQKR